MTFLAPSMLLGALAVGIPIALHFFFRSRYRVVPWAAMKFLLTSIEQTSRRLKFQELLLLALRCLLLALLAFALARPLSSVVRGAGRGDAVDAVFLIDTSFSMGAADGAASRLDRAKEAALKVIDQLPSHSTVQIVTCADRAALLGPQSPGNLDQAKAIVQKLQTTSLSTDLFPGVVEAAGVLQRGQASNKELYLFSDMQKLGWQQQAGSMTRVLQDVKEKATVFLVHCGRKAPANVAIVGITPQSGVPRPGERVGFAVLLRNTGAESVNDLKVTLTVDGDDKAAETQSLAKIDPGETRPVSLTAKLEKPGLRVLTATVTHDDLPGDNRFDQVVLVRDQVNILVVDGGLNERDPERSSSFFLMHALLPVKDTERAKYHVQPRLVTPRLASPALLAKQDLCILVNVPLQADFKKRAETLPADFVDELARFVRDGHGLIIYAGDNVDPKAYNEVLGAKHGLLPLPIKGFLERQAKEPLLIDRASANLPAYWKFKEDDYYKGFNEIQAWKTLELEAGAKPKGPAEATLPQGEGGEKKDPPSPDTQGEKKTEAVTVALRFGNGVPLVVSKKVDAGEVILIGTAAEPGFKADTPNPTWNDWPLRFGAFIPFVDVTVSHLMHGQTQTYNVVAGEKVDWYPTEKQVRNYMLVHPDGTAVRLGFPEKRNNRAVVTASDLPSAGIYRISSSLPQQAQGEEPLIVEPALTQKSGTPLAVVPDLRESQDLGSLGEAELNQMLGFTPIHMTAGGDQGTQGSGDRLNREWTTWLLLAVLLLALGESALAFWCGRAW